MEKLKSLGQSRGENAIFVYIDKNRMVFLLLYALIYARMHIARQTTGIERLRLAAFTLAMVYPRKHLL